jgi:hypothetical protein
MLLVTWVEVKSDRIVSHSWMRKSSVMKRAIVVAGILMVLAFQPLGASTGWAKNKGVASFSTTCLTEDDNLSKGATIAIKPAILWPPNHKMVRNLAVSMTLNSDADSPIPLSFAITSITDDQVVHDDAGGHGCGVKTSKQGLDWRPNDLDTNHPLIISGILQKTSESIATEPGIVQLRSERCATDGSRVYELEVSCCDNSQPYSPICDADPEILQVTVPHDHRQTQQVH